MQRPPPPSAGLSVSETGRSKFDVSSVALFADIDPAVPLWVGEEATVGPTTMKVQ